MGRSRVHNRVVMRRHSSLLLLAVLGCSTERSSTQPEPNLEPATRTVSPSEAPTRSVVERPQGAPIDERFTANLLAAAADYQKWGRVDELPNLAPVLCRAPTGLDYGFPSHARLSKADESAHGRKLYYLFAGEGRATGRDRYRSLGAEGGEKAELPIGFTVVKESWKAVPGSAPKQSDNPSNSIGDPNAFAPPAPVNWVEEGGEVLLVGEKADLFIMTKVGPADTPGTDAGWIYGTVTADGKTVTSAGTIEQCMGCHEAATHERLFGLQKTKALVEVPKDWSGEPASTERLGITR